MAAEKPVCRSGPAWIRERLKRKDALAALTGQDAAALQAFLHLVELYGRADGPGRRNAILAMRFTVLTMQPSTRHLAKAGIPHVLDWGDEERIWTQVAPSAAADAATAADRNEHHPAVP